MSTFGLAHARANHPTTESSARDFSNWVAIFFFVVVTLLMLWDQTLTLRTAVPPHQDAYFSIWRIEWIAHQLRTDPARLFDANIFYPSRNTLAYSDPTLLEGLIAAPLFWLGASGAAAYNSLVLLSFVVCGLGAYALCR